MSRTGSLLASTLALCMALACTMPAFADPPGGKPNRAAPERSSPARHDSHSGSLHVDIVIGNDTRMAIRDYYGSQFRAGHCPPGLAKKHNGCMPPGQAKKWALGRPLPRDVIFHDLPQDLLRRIQQPPQSYRYVRVASDILMIAIGTGLVAAAIEDLSRIS